MQSALHVYPGFMLGNCTGTFWGIEYCYLVRGFRIGDNSQILSFDFLSLSQNESNFSVTKTISISDSPQQDNCAETIIMSGVFVCCTAQSIANHTITPSDFSFGILVRRRLVFFSDNATGYRVNRFEKVPFLDGELPPQFDFTEENISIDRPFPLMRFLIGTILAIACVLYEG